MKEEHKAYIKLGITIIIIVSIQIGIAEHYTNKQKENLHETCKLYHLDGLDKPQFLNGVYYEKGFYCVWTKGRDGSAINKTETHEQCHALINENKNTSKHFCQDGNFQK